MQSVNVSAHAARRSLCLHLLRGVTEHNVCLLASTSTRYSLSMERLRTLQYRTAWGKTSMYKIRKPELSWTTPTCLRGLPWQVTQHCSIAMQIGDMRGLGGLVLTLWHELKIKANIYNVKVQPQHHCRL